MEKYNFEWNQLGDIDSGRPNLGKSTSVAVYRLMQYTMRAVLENEYGDETTRSLLYKAGELAGQEFCKNVLDCSLPLNKFIAQLHDVLVDLSVGILKIEKSDVENMSFVATVAEDLDCSGLPLKGVTVCDYDEGFIAGIFEIYTGKEFFVKEIDCWTTGERTCRFSIDLKENVAI
ncbi:MAG: 4-vinyl reductase [Marinilabiliaceae bacterium]|nr:4-vinyl reductase [Marinilabiliaceae bacterium]